MICGADAQTLAGNSTTLRTGWHSPQLVHNAILCAGVGVSAAVERNERVAYIHDADCTTDKWRKQDLDKDVTLPILAAFFDKDNQLRVCDSAGKVWPPTAEEAIANPYAGPNHFDVRSDGSVWSWGENAHGQLGHGDLVPIDKASPKRIDLFWKGGMSVEHVVSSKWNTIFWTSAGKLYCCGADVGGHGQTGAIIEGLNTATPMLIDFGAAGIDTKARDMTITAVQCGIAHTVVRAGQSLIGWGSSTNSNSLLSCIVWLMVRVRR